MSLDPNFGGVAVPGTIQSIYPIPDSIPAAQENTGIRDKWGGRGKICYLNNDGSPGKEVHDLQSTTIDEITQIFREGLLSGLDETFIKDINQIELEGFHKANTSPSTKDQNTRRLSHPQQVAMEKIQRIVSEWVTTNKEKSGGVSFVAKQHDLDSQTLSSDGNPGSAAEHAANDGLNGSPQPHPPLDDSNTTNNIPPSTRPSLVNDLRNWCNTLRKRCNTSTEDQAEQLASVLNTPNAITEIETASKELNLHLSWNRVLNVLKMLKKRGK